MSDPSCSLSRVPLRVQVLSDLHHEHLRAKGICYIELLKIDPSADVVVLAGDIDNDLEARDLLLALAARGHHVVYVLGNHEGYNARDWFQMVAEFRALADGHEKIHFLHQSSCVISDVEFVGATLWTEGILKGQEGIADLAAANAQNEMPDFKRIKAGGKLLTFRQTNEWFCKDIQYIDQALSNSRAAKKVVVTHHLPSRASLAERHRGSLLNVAFVSDVPEDILMKADLCIHGHTHSSCDYLVGDTRVVCNPRGYPRGSHAFENEHFIETLVLEV